MKKLGIMLGAVAMIFAANAANIQWQVTSALAGEKGYTVYVFDTARADNYCSIAELISGAIGSGTISEVGGGSGWGWGGNFGGGGFGGGATYQMLNSVTSTSDNFSKTAATLYAVLVSGSDATSYRYGSFDVANNVYGNMESSPGVFTFNTTQMNTEGTISDIGGGDPIAGEPTATPEPTSGILLLLGIAGLALRRKQA